MIYVILNKKKRGETIFVSDTKQTKRRKQKKVCGQSESKRKKKLYF